MVNIDTQILKDIIIEKATPHIYAFSTNTIPNYIKIGDTFRSVDVRIDEWSMKYPEIKKIYQKSAIVKKDNKEAIFRDYSVHQYLRDDLNKENLSQKKLIEITSNSEIYYSNEFYKDVEKEEIDKAINDINEDFESNGGKYKFYSDRGHQNDYHFIRGDVDWEPRDNQKEAIEKFKKAYKNGKGEKNFLMYAVMRFGKTFTSLMCAKAMKAKLILVVSGKKDVEVEWKKTVESAHNFKNFIFLKVKDLDDDNQAITKYINKNNKVVVFLTLQDLMHSSEIVQRRHSDLFSKEIDLLIVDETHFGARAEKYGAVLKDAERYEIENLKTYDKDEYIDFYKADETLKEINNILNVKVRMHLSGTPYRILMNNEFKEKQIISYCQYSDIIKAQKKWEEKHFCDDNYEEWHNPYFGFPQMVRFAFNPSKNARKKLEEYKNLGYSSSLSKLFEPKSIIKDENNQYTKFINEDEILEIFNTIDGKNKDDELLSILDDDTLNKNELCQHIVVVLPFCASCDALEHLLKNNRFKNLNEYEILNISGLDVKPELKSADKIIKKIKDYDNNGKKTITLTVNRMLTGTTVPQWDTMLYFKDTSSPQEYDQAIFRLQSQNIETKQDDKGNEIKINKKQQTLLVDFDIDRMFYLQEAKSFIYNSNTSISGNENLEERLDIELGVSPIIMVNANKLEKVTPRNIMDAVSNYSKNRGVYEETNDIDVDRNILRNKTIREEIEKQYEIGSKKGLSIDPYEGEGSDLELEVSLDEQEVETDTNSSSSNENNNDQESLDKKIKTYYARILFYAFLTNNDVKSLSEIISGLKNKDNKRIAKNLGLKKDVLILLRDNLNPYILKQLDYKIMNMNSLSIDSAIDEEEKALTFIKKFDRISDSEVLTPENICNDMIKLIDDNEYRRIVDNEGKILDIASKSAEFTISIYKHLLDLKINKNKLRDIFYSIPTSSITYEFTRKMYSLLGLNIKNISNFNSYELININNSNRIFDSNISSKIKMTNNSRERKLNMKFDVIVGNPPYQLSDGGAQASSTPIYNLFIELAKKINPKYIVMITPSRWFSGGKGLDNFRNDMLHDERIEVIHDFPNAKDCFSGPEIKGGVNYFKWNSTHKGDCEVVTHKDKEITSRDTRPLLEKGADIFIRHNGLISIYRKVIELNEESFSDIVSPQKPFGLRGDFFANPAKYGLPEVMDKPYTNGYTIRGLENNKRTEKYIDDEYPIPKREYLNGWKMFMARNQGSGQFGEKLSIPIFAGKKELCTETYVVIGLFKTKEEMMNCWSYIKTKFFRALLGVKKNDQSAASGVYQYIPMQDFSKPWTDEELYKKYKLTKEEIKYIEDNVLSMDE